MASQVPPGTGLGSSGSVAVCLINGLAAWEEQPLDPDIIAEKACYVEIEKMGMPVGKQDQYASAFGGLNCIKYSADGVVVEPLLVSETTRQRLEQRLMLFFTGRTRKSETILSEQKESIAEKEKILRQMASEARGLKKALETGDYYHVGRALKGGWEHKKKLASKISDPQLDLWHQKALDAGASGGKISGAGGGGFFILFVPPNSRQKVRTALSELREMPFHLECDGSKVIFNTGVR